MVERLIGSFWVKCEISEVKAGDIFRTREDGGGKHVSPPFLAEGDAVYVPASAEKHGRWEVKSRFYQQQTPISGRRH